MATLLLGIMLNTVAENWSRQFLTLKKKQNVFSTPTRAPKISKNEPKWKYASLTREITDAKWRSEIQLSTMSDLHRTFGPAACFAPRRFNRRHICLKATTQFYSARLSVAMSTNTIFYDLTHGRSKRRNVFDAIENFLGGIFSAMLHNGNILLLM